MSPFYATRKFLLMYSVVFGVLYHIFCVTSSFIFFFFVTVTGALSELQIAFISRETLRGLGYLHNMGKMHRDIKVSADIYL